MMISTEPSVLAILFLIATFAGFVDAIAGGGGLITTPALLSFGIAPHTALATNKLMSSFGTAIAAYTFIKKQIFSPKKWLICALATLTGSTLGALLIIYMDANFIKKFIPPLLILVGIYMLIPKPKNKTQFEDKPVSAAKQTTAGLSLGFYDGFIGPGTGSFWTVLNNTYFKQNFMASSGIARFMNLMSNIAALVVFIFSGRIMWLFGLFLSMGFMLGSFIGARSAIKYGERYIRPIFIGLVFVIAGRLVYLEYFVHG